MRDAQQMIEADMTFADWIKSVPPEIADDPLWKIEAYRLALFVADLGWFDVTKLIRDKRTAAIADQLFRAPTIGLNVQSRSMETELDELLIDSPMP